MTEYQEAMPETVVPVRAREYYYDEIGRYMRRPYLVENWCRENGIRAARYSVGTESDVWVVPNDEDRLIFVLRWS